MEIYLVRWKRWNGEYHLVAKSVSWAYDLTDLMPLLSKWVPIQCYLLIIYLTGIVGDPIGPARGQKIIFSTVITSKSE